MVQLNSFVAYVVVVSRYYCATIVLLHNRTEISEGQQQQQRLCNNSIIADAVHRPLKYLFIQISEVLLLRLRNRLHYIMQSKVRTF